ncbi:MAG: hypothetical protein KC635_26300, partial [Myxococcales bacterium]|nr:hypothetical protein [Myxococcales bacterium]
MTLSRTLGLAVAAALTLIVVASPASLAGPPPGQEKDRSVEDAQAQREYDKAVRLTRSGRAQEALEHFEKALPRMNGGSDIFYNLVMVSEAAKRWDKVLLYAQGFLVLEPGSDDAAEIEQKLDIAVKRLTKAKRAPAPVTFTVDPPEARVLVESTPIASAERPTALFVPGKHTAEATLADYTPATVAFEVKAGEEPAAVALRLVKIIYEGTLAVVTEPA